MIAYSVRMIKISVPSCQAPTTIEAAPTMPEMHSTLATCRCVRLFTLVTYLQRCCHLSYHDTTSLHALHGTLLLVCEDCQITVAAVDRAAACNQKLRSSNVMRTRPLAVTLHP